MDFREIGDRIGTEAITEQIVQGKKFNEDLNGALPDEAQGTALQILMARIVGTAVAEHTVGYGGKVSVAPNTGDGLDLEELCVVMQVNEAGDFVAIWWKVGPSPTAWVNLAGEEDDHLVIADGTDDTPGTLAGKVAAETNISVVVEVVDGVRKLVIRGKALSNELPLPDGIADPGDTSSGQATARRHVHPSADTAGGDLYMIGSFDAVDLVLFGNGVIGFNLDPGMQATPSGAFDLRRSVTTGGNLGPY